MITAARVDRQRVAAFPSRDLEVVQSRLPMSAAVSQRDGLIAPARHDARAAAILTNRSMRGVRWMMSRKRRFASCSSTWSISARRSPDGGERRAQLV
jgi:hypothetical protein